MAKPHIQERLSVPQGVKAYVQQPVHRMRLVRDLQHVCLQVEKLSDPEEIVGTQQVSYSSMVKQVSYSSMVKQVSYSSMVKLCVLC